MSFKLMLLLFGFVALAVAVPIEDTEEKAEPAEPVEADAEIPEAPLEDFESADESEEENVEDSEEEPEADDKEEEPENEVEAKEDDENEKRGRYRKVVKACARPVIEKPTKKCRKLGYLCVMYGNKKKKFHHRVCYFCKTDKRGRRFLIITACQTCPRCRRRYFRARLFCRRVCRKGKCKRKCKCKCRRPCRYGSG